MVKDTHYYDLLQVSTEATGIEIKKAYRKMALKFHPDKNPDDPTAEAKFQEIAESYQILSDPEKRKLYDEVGLEQLKEAGVGGGEMDPREFFGMMFGGEGFGEWIGELNLLNMMVESMEQHEEEEEEEGGKSKTESVTGAGALQSGAAENSAATTGAKKESASKIDYEKMKKRQEEEAKKVDELALRLIKRMDPLLSTGELKNEAVLAFQQSISKEIESLKLESFGLDICHLIGKVYIFKSTAYLKSQKAILGKFHKVSSSFKQRTNTAKNMWSMLSSAQEAQSTLNAMAKLQEQELEEGSEQVDEYEKAKFERTMTGKFIMVAWASTKFEIEGTLNRVCSKVLNDKSVPIEIRKLRAEVMGLMGLLFKNAQRDANDDEDGGSDFLMFEELMKEAKATKAKDFRRPASGGVLGANNSSHSINRGKESGVSTTDKFAFGDATNTETKPKKKLFGRFSV